MIINNNFKLIHILDRNFDKQTDQLYQPLRQAIGNNSALTSQKIQFQMDEHSEYPISNLKNSNLQTRINMKNSILIPINKKLTATNNQNKIMKAKSRSFRTLSVDNKIGAPIKQDEFKNYLQTGASFKQIVYDYETTKTNSIKSSYLPMVNSIKTREALIMQKTRSSTCIAPSYNLIGHQIGQKKGTQRLIGQIIISQKPSIQSPSQYIQSPNQTIQSPNQTIRSPMQPIHSPKQAMTQMKGKTKEITEDYYMQQYYQDSKKYKFNKDSIKSKNRQYEQISLNKSKDYKYNLFNMLDEQINLKCATGMCTKNEVIASKLKNQW